jgi:hypothetical protein
MPFSFFSEPEAKSGSATDSFQFSTEPELLSAGTSKARPASATSDTAPTKQQRTVHFGLTTALSEPSSRLEVTVPPQASSSSGPPLSSERLDPFFDRTSPAAARPPVLGQPKELAPLGVAASSGLAFGVAVPVGSDSGALDFFSPDPPNGAGASTQQRLVPGTPYSTPASTKRPPLDSLHGHTIAEEDPHNRAVVHRSDYADNLESRSRLSITVDDLAHRTAAAQARTKKFLTEGQKDLFELGHQVDTALGERSEAGKKLNEHAFELAQMQDNILLLHAQASLVSKGNQQHVNNSN